MVWPHGEIAVWLVPEGSSFLLYAC